MVNPFAFGRVVRGENFCDRIEEMEKIKAISASKNSLVIVSPRRYGKTSLVINALEKHTLPFIFVDCFEITDEKSLLEKITTAYFQALRKGDILDKLKSLSKSLQLEYSFSAQGITVKITRHEATALRTILQEATQKHLLVLDEFQELFVVDKNLVKKLRSVLQLLSQGMIFLGSKKHLLLYLFSDQRSPFYNFGEIMYLQKIPAEKWLGFVKEKFQTHKIPVTEQEIQTLLSFSDLIPFYVQYLFYHYWEEKRKNSVITPALFLEKLLLSHSYMYEEMYIKLPANQKKALQIVAQGNEKVFSAENISEFKITSSQTLNKALLLLCEKGFLEKNGSYQFNDPLFKRWVKEKLSP